jgi:hypothetical protein
MMGVEAVGLGRGAGTRACRAETHLGAPERLTVLPKRVPAASLTAEMQERRDESRRGRLRACATSADCQVVPGRSLKETRP